MASSARFRSRRTRLRRKPGHRPPGTYARPAGPAGRLTDIGSPGLPARSPAGRRGGSRPRRGRCRGPRPGRGGRPRCGSPPSARGVPARSTGTIPARPRRRKTSRFVSGSPRRSSDTTCEPTSSAAWIASCSVCSTKRSSRRSSAIRSGRARVRSSRTQVSMKASFLATSSGSVIGGALRPVRPRPSPEPGSDGRADGSGPGRSTRCGTGPRSGCGRPGRDRGRGARP